MAFLSNLLDKLARPPEEIRSENLRRWAESIDNRVPISEVEARTKGRVAGVVQNLRIDPRAGRNSIEATIIDGTGEIVVRWLGRQELRGVRLGIGLIVDGTFGADSNGEKVILNPEYVLVSGPEQG